MDNKELTVDGVIDALNAGCRVLLMTRHAARPHIDHEDPTFGETLPITPDGVRCARALGERLHAFAAETQFLASPLRRTVMTAQAIADGMGIERPDIPTADRLGNSTFYFADAYAVFQLFRDGSFFEKVFAYLRDGHQTGFADLYEATDDLEAWCLNRFTARLGIFTTHDLYNGAFLTARGAVHEFTESSWVRFLDSAAILIRPDGQKQYALVRA